jgi:hypothetical protein
MIDQMEFQERPGFPEPDDVGFDFHEENDDDVFFYYESLNPERTGLPFVLWFAFRYRRELPFSVWVSYTPQLSVPELRQVVLSPTMRVLGDLTLLDGDMELLHEWVDLNYVALARFWVGGVFEEEWDIFDYLRPLPVAHPPVGEQWAIGRTMDSLDLRARIVPVPPAVADGIEDGHDDMGEHRGSGASAG